LRHRDHRDHRERALPLCGLGGLCGATVLLFVVNTLEVWEIVNETNPGEMMDPLGMAHSIHIHGGQFQVIGREVLPELRAGWEGVKDGYVGRVEGHRAGDAWRAGQAVDGLPRLPRHLPSTTATTSSTKTRG
jgi:hypothetical protein